MSCPSLRRLGRIGATLVVLFGADRLPAQCGLSWLPGHPAAGPNGNTRALLNLPNGELIAGGTFTVADAAIVNHIARWDGTTWRPVGAGLSGHVLALARLPNGDIVAGGAFTSAGGQPASCIALWNGSTWAALGTGLNGAPRALLVLPNGDLIAGGTFTTAGATTVNRIARWNGVAWSSLGSGFADGAVSALARLPNGDIVAGGDMPSGSGYYGLQRWDGTTWQVIPGLSPVLYDSVTHLAVRTNGDLMIGGSLPLGGSYSSVVRWDGTTMHSVVTSFVVGALLAASNGDVLIGGTSLLRWDGVNSTPIAGAPSQVTALIEDAIGRLVVGTTTSQTPTTRAVTRYDGFVWQDLGGSAAPPTVTAMVRLAGGDVVVGGVFASFGGVPANNLARWNGSVWSPLGLGVDGPVRSLAAAPNGDLIVSGSFANAGGAPANHVARWDGQAWSTLGGGLPSQVNSIAVGTNGDIMVCPAGITGASRFDGTNWTSVQFPTANAFPLTVAALTNGDFAFGGIFFNMPTQVGMVLYSGGVVTAVAGAMSVVQRLFLADDGSVFAYGPGLRRWDGTTWSTLPNPPGTNIGQLPNGELISCGNTAAIGGSLASCVFRLRSTGWESFGEVQGGIASVVTASGYGDLFLAGTMQTAAGQVSMRFVHAVPTCPASTTVVGSGCSGGAGPVTLRADNGAWVGGIFRSTAMGMTTNSLALQLVGVQPTIQPLPGGAPGCSLFVLPLFADLLLPVGGEAGGVFMVPAQPSLAGQQLRLQVVGIELAGGSIVRLTSTNALQLTIGAL